MNLKVIFWASPALKGVVSAADGKVGMTVTDKRPKAPWALTPISHHQYPPYPYLLAVLST